MKTAGLDGLITGLLQDDSGRRARSNAAKCSVAQHVEVDWATIYNVCGRSEVGDDVEVVAGGDGEVDALGGVLSVKLDRAAWAVIGGSVQRRVEPR